MIGDEVANDCHFAILVTGILSPDPLPLRVWCVDIATKLLPQPILHVV